ncbi:unnamed protein product [Rotaria socialis]|uniref:Uncharacterized protein n=2 Tax=Rotaria socialis TaxID=392032 RepID=A0A817SB96_9BILA|nr:unnamed protein product [Rotaria socialis]
MMQALTYPNSSVRNEPRLAIGTHCALNVWLVLTGQLLMLGDNTTNFEVQKITEISFRSDWWEHNPGTGANLVWMLQIELYRSLATNNRTGIEQGFTRMWQDIVVSPLGGQGIQNDWSYHFQRTQLLSGAYMDKIGLSLCLYLFYAQELFNMN